jgi:hypothetical protein
MLRNFGPVAKLLQLPSALVVVNWLVPPDPSVAHLRTNDCEVLEYPRLAVSPPEPVA